MVVKKRSEVMYRCGGIYGRFGYGTGVFARVSTDLDGRVKDPSLVILFAGAMSRGVIHYTMRRTNEYGTSIVQYRADDGGTLRRVLRGIYTWWVCLDC